VWRNRACGLYTVVPAPWNNFITPTFAADGSFQVQYWGMPGQTYILQVSVDLVNWIPISTNTPASAPFGWVDPSSTNVPVRFYRVITQ